MNTNNGITVLSLFDGMSCGQIALRELGIPVSRYYASEIDKFAIAQTQLNFPNTIQLGDVERWREWDIDWSNIGIVLAGSPCQGFSFSGKGLAFDDPRSKLFFVFVEIWEHVKKHNPAAVFLLENVRMLKSHLRVISEYCGVFPVRINSNLVSAQNRDRYYWTNIRTKQMGLFGEVHSDIPQPEDRGIFLRDILEEDVDEKYYLSDRVIKTLSSRSETYKFNAVDGSSKSGCLRTGVHKMGTTDTYIKVDKNGKTNCPTSVDKDNLILQCGRGDNKGGFHCEKSPTIMCSNDWDGNNLLLIGNIYENKNQSGRIYDVNGKAATIKAGAGGVGAKTGLYLDGFRIRRLTPTECARLQTIPDWYKWKCSDTQQYRMLGNGWSIAVIVHILKYLL
jgi:DNA-methyltransferase (dcm)